MTNYTFSGIEGNLAHSLLADAQTTNKFALAGGSTPRRSTPSLVSVPKAKTLECVLACLTKEGFLKEDITKEQMAYEIVRSTVDCNRPAMKQIRNLKIVLQYYGLTGNDPVSLKQLAETHEDSGSHDNLARIVKCANRNWANGESRTALLLHKTLISRNYWTETELVSAVSKRKIASALPFKSIRRILESHGLKHEYERVIVKGSLKDILVVKKGYECHARRYTAIITENGSSFKRLEGLRQNLGDFYETAKHLVTEKEAAWQCAANGDTWYILKTKMCSIDSQLGKVFQTVNTCQIAELEDSIHRHFTRTMTKGTCPPKTVLGRYITTHPSIAIADGIVQYKGELKSLTPLEKAISEHLLNGPDTGASITKAMTIKGYGKANIAPTLNRSAFIHVDQTKGPRRYTYSLLPQGF